MVANQSLNKLTLIEKPNGVSRQAKLMKNKPGNLLRS
jgi:hypothetical protein